jgi:hypothetical protein
VALRKRVPANKALVVNRFWQRSLSTLTLELRTSSAAEISDNGYTPRMKRGLIIVATACLTMVCPRDLGAEGLHRGEIRRHVP